MVNLPRVDLLDAEHVQRLCATVAHRYGIYLSADDREDLLSHLLEVAVRLSHTYDPARDPGGSFGTYLPYLLPRRAHDWLRQRNGRTRWRFRDGRVYERERPVVRSLDALDQRGDDSLGEALRAGDGDPAADSGPPCGGLLVAGDQQRDRDLGLLRAAAARRARR